MKIVIMRRENVLVHVLMLCSKFELIPSGQRPCTIVQGLWPNFIKNEKE